MMITYIMNMIIVQCIYNDNNMTNVVCRSLPVQVGHWEPGNSTGANLVRSHTTTIFTSKNAQKKYASSYCYP